MSHYEESLFKSPPLVAFDRIFEPKIAKAEVDDIATRLLEDVQSCEDFDMSNIPEINVSGLANFSHLHKRADRAGRAIVITEGLFKFTEILSVRQVVMTDTHFGRAHVFERPQPTHGEYVIANGTKLPQGERTSKTSYLYALGSLSIHGTDLEQRQETGQSIDFTIPDTINNILFTTVHEHLCQFKGYRLIGKVTEEMKKP